MRNPRSGRGRLPVIATIAAAAIGAAALAEHAPVLHATPLGADSLSALARPPISTGAVARLEDLSDAFATVAAHVKPSVVYITARHEAQQVTQSQGPSLDLSQIPPELRDFFRSMPGMPGTPRGRSRGGVASGSGFVVSNDGYILTNNHVVDGASEVTVRLLDRREFKARVVGRDPNTDVAVLKIDAKNLTAAPLGNSDAARVGEWVLAVGNPLGENLTFTVTQGIISAKGRALALPGQSQHTIQDFIQTDAAINPGNSGGPLVNVHGEVVGINSAIESPTGYNAGYGFAVPINLARAVMGQIIKSGRVERVALGIAVRDASADDAAYVGLDEIRGVLVSDFGDATSPAQRAGMQAGDVILSIDGKRVDYVAQLQEAIAFRSPGDVATVEVARKGGKRVTVRVPLQRVSEPTTEIASRGDDAGSNDAARGSSAPLLGVKVAPMDAGTARQLQLPSDVQGVIVTDVEDGSSASSHLATPSTGGPDVILSVEGTAVRTPDELRAALRQARAGDVVSLRVYNVPAKTKRVERVRLGSGR
ncbi:MAG: Do family serine endopeptidase [Gemmatimonadaceae bacterium]|nr:Do family serine endopeptidase [Gemmatimonadaceae bacterium]